MGIIHTGVKGLCALWGGERCDLVRITTGSGNSCKTHYGAASQKPFLSVQRARQGFPKGKLCWTPRVTTNSLTAGRWSLMTDTPGG